MARRSPAGGSRKKLLSFWTAALVAVPALVVVHGASGDHAGQANDLNRAKSKLRNPSSLSDRAPSAFKARFDTSKGAFVVEVHREWAPIGVDRFYNLVANGFYDDCRFFRVLSTAMAQTGINGTPSIQAIWSASTLRDDPVKQSNRRGWVSFATAGANSRSTQFFINVVDNSAHYDRLGIAPFGEVTSGMEVVDSLYSGYGDGAPRGSGPEQGKIISEGNPYLAKDFPKLDYVKKASIEK